MNLTTYQFAIIVSSIIASRSFGNRNFFHFLFSSISKRRDGLFFFFFALKSPILLFRLLRYEFSPSINWFFSLVLSFHLIFLRFLMFLLSTYCGVWLFVGFSVGDSNNNVVSIRLRSHIKSLFISVFHQTLNLRYLRHIMIISCVGLESFFFLLLTWMLCHPLMFLVV